MAYTALDLDAAAAALKAGRAIAFPTETFYGLGCDALNPDAIGAVYAMKQRLYRRPLPVIIGDAAQLSRIAKTIPPIAERLMAVCWPGPLSILFPAIPEAPDLLTAGTGRVAVRFSPHPACIDLCRASGLILTASSANISGRPPVTRPEDLDPELTRGLGGVYVEGPPPAGGAPSTIVDIL
ncbi:MAG: threonylcarbamoyl-AMP synthase, partial [Deltaproteobacteria bacterium]|nr:threonylcarbamoyl-AMP synthase [Deltaproteobacteria bacterium]